MPTQKQVSYWTVCWKWGFLPYPCKKTETRWCYQFSWLVEKRYGVFCSLKGCENGVKYCWNAFCFGLFGTAVFYNLEKCFKKQRRECGTCGPTPET